MDRTEKWLHQRVGRITSSLLPKLAKKGKGVEFGETAITEMYSIRYERRTAIARNKKSNYNFDWGHENEPNAFAWLKLQLMDEVKSCNEDFEDIVFQRPFDGFGDSPDGFIYDFDGRIKAVVEVKCPVDVAKIEELFMRTEPINEKDEYYWQLIGHFIGTPEAEEVLYLVYDGYADDGKIFILKREDHLANIEYCEKRIRAINEIIRLSLEIKGLTIEAACTMVRVG